MRAKSSRQLPESVATPCEGRPRKRLCSSPATPDLPHRRRGSRRANSAGVLTEWTASTCPEHAIDGAYRLPYVSGQPASQPQRPQPWQMQKRDEVVQLTYRCHCTFHLPRHLITTTYNHKRLHSTSVFGHRPSFWNIGVQEAEYTDNMRPRPLVDDNPREAYCGS